MDRIIGEINGGKKGTTIIAIGGIHGNEPTGVSAIEKVISELKSVEDIFKGRFLGLRGNISALKQEKRFVDEDLNRIWLTSIVDKVRRTKKEDLKSSERIELKELLTILDPIIEESRSDEKVIFCDLHSFSAETGIFAISSRAEEHVEVLEKLKIPLIFGIEKALLGTALKFMQLNGHIGFAIEAGTHFSEKAEYNAIAAPQVLLVSTGCLAKNDIPNFKAYNNFLKEQTDILPQKVEFVYKHIIEEGDRFMMNSGFKNFDVIKKGDSLASDKHGEIKAQSDGFLLMPLYQQQGEDGFFVVKSTS